MIMSGCKPKVEVVCSCGVTFSTTKAKQCDECRRIRVRKNHSERCRIRRKAAGLNLRPTSAEYDNAIERKLALLDSIRIKRRQNDRWNPYAPVRQMSDQTNGIP
jgi:hypothetical protein